MLLDQENSDEEKIKFVSRIYQNEILKKCIERNTIVYLPTGAGKTHIAIMALKHFAKVLLRPTAEGRKWSVYLAATKALAEQQAKKIACATPLKVVCITSDSDVDNWESDQWRQILEEFQIISATVQTILNAVTLGYLKISDINLIVFDECHHTRKGHPMLMLMRHFENVPKADQPRVIGLTGVLTSTSIKPKNVLEDLEFLEAALSATITTAKGAAFNDVLMYSTCPEESLVTYEVNALTEIQEFVVKNVDAMLKLIQSWHVRKKIQEKYEKICTTFCTQLKNLGLYGGIMANLATIVDLESMRQEADSSTIKLLVRALITSFEEILHILKTKFNEQAHTPNELPLSSTSSISEHDPETILTHSSEHVENLLNSLKEFAGKNTEPMKGLIFVRERNTARILCSVVKGFFDSYPELNVNVDFMVGQIGMPGSIETLIGNKNNNKVLDKFKSGAINLIVATNVLEEGIDLQECNLVICYDEPQHFRAYVQMKGRARMKKSQYMIMTNEQKKLEKQIDEWQEVIEILKEHLTNIAIDRTPPEQDQIDKALEQKYNESFTTKNGVTVDYYSAIPFVYWYCSSLQKDMFTVLVPDFNHTQHENGFSMTLLLPIQSPLNEIITGKTLPSLKLAKKSVAFKTIIDLYRLGELSENLLPFDQQNCLDLYKDVYFKSWDRFGDDTDEPNMAGTNKHHRIHPIQTPAALIDSMPKIKKQLYLYEMKMNPVPETFDTSDDYIKGLHELLKESKQGYAILTAKPLPRMASMKFGQSFGQIACSINYEPRLITLIDADNLAKLKKFHLVLFRDVLGIWKDFFVYDHQDSILIVPINDNQIDWNIVEQFQIWPGCKPKSVWERENIVYKNEDWLNKVVCPWYRPNSNENMRYVVTHIPSEMTACSEFPDKTYRNFADYMEKKYKHTIERIVDPKQFMLGVKQTTSNFNILTLGGGENDGQKNTRNSGEFLIPELCHNFGYPGDLWLKAVILPSVLHRMTYILHAENLRIKINECVGLQIDDYEPYPLIENMPKKMIEEPKSQIQSDQLYLDDMATTAANILRFDVEAEVFGSEFRELIDLERHFSTAYEIDVAYVCDEFRKFKAMNSNNNNPFLSPQLNANVPALCGVENVEKLRIKMLDTKLSTTNDRGVEQHELVAAITSASSADVFHMEKFEVLGDAFLKFGVSLYLIQKHSEWQEGSLTSMKGQIVGNRNLCYAAIRLKLPGMIKIHNFSPKHDWQPPMFKVEDQVQQCMKEHDILPDLLNELTLSEFELENGVVLDDTLAHYVEKFMDADEGGEFSTMQNLLGNQRVSDKTCADCVEAILGTCVKSIGVERTFKVLEMLGILPCGNGNEDITGMLDKKLCSPRIRTNISDYDIDYFLPNYQNLEKTIGYEFLDRAYLLQALTHPSYPTNRVTGCYQQLEFLGDAVLDFLITAYIFERCPHMNPGQLTDLRSALVNNVTLACLCVKYNIHAHILSQSSSLTNKIYDFVEIQSKVNHEVGDHVVRLMEEQDMAEYVDVPKALGDVFEAIIGAIFLDSGNDLKATWKIVYRMMQKELDKFMANVPIQMVRQLYEFPNANPKFDDPVVDEEGIASVVARFTCKKERLSVCGRGTNKQNAKRAAAKMALNLLNG